MMNTVYTYSIYECVSVCVSVCVCCLCRPPINSLQVERVVAEKLNLLKVLCVLVGQHLRVQPAAKGTVVNIQQCATAICHCNIQKCRSAIMETFHSIGRVSFRNLVMGEKRVGGVVNKRG